MEFEVGQRLTVFEVIVKPTYSKARVKCNGQYLTASIFPDGPLLFDADCKGTYVPMPYVKKVGTMIITKLK